jgi:uracil-DNA glycosylase
MVTRATRTTRRARRDASPRILGTRVGALYPPRGDVTAMVYGEAPGPRGADKSGIPFFGDRSGKLVYRALIDAGRCTLDADIDAVKWDGEALREAGLAPHLVGTALSNAYDVCPSDNGVKFRAPSRAELTSPENVQRVEAEIERARRRGLRSVVVLGRHADRLLGDHLGLRGDETLVYHQLVHPSPLGLIWLKRKRDVSMQEIEREWMETFVGMLNE